MRINKFIRDSGICSRRKADELILSGAVTVNGKLILSLGMDINETSDLVTVSGRPISISKKHRYIALHKPKGFITSLDDPQGRPTVMDLLGKGWYLTPVGRLDFNTSGLLLLTDDGWFVNKITHPKSEIPKTYLAKVTGLVDQHVMENIRNGVDITTNVGKYTTKPAQAEIIRTTKVATWLKITITEGKNRQVRKMLERFSLVVSDLKRIAIGGVTLGDLPAGKWRNLKHAEVESLMSK